MKGFFLLVFPILILTNGICQSVSKIIFIDYDRVIKDVYNSNPPTGLNRKYDYLKILLLDSSEIKIIEKIVPNKVNTFRKYYSGSIRDGGSKFIPSKQKSLKKIFYDSILLKRIILSSFSYLGAPPDAKLYPKIYIKDDKIAIYEIYDRTCSEGIRISLTDLGILRELIWATEE